jgi:hypothetical protein
LGKRVSPLVDYPGVEVLDVPVVIAQELSLYVFQRPLKINVTNYYYMCKR